MRISQRMTRRRALTICAGAGAATALGLQAGQAKMPELEWRGRALGGQARMVIRHRDEAAARKLTEYCVGEIERLERIFSLYRGDSEILHLNREGRLDGPSRDMRLVLGEARHYGNSSGGSFDVTVQPLWKLYSEHFAARPDAGTGPAPGEVERARRLVDYRGIDLDNGRVRLANPGMAITLNGIAQGYITDRVASILRDSGMDDVLVDLGEIRALDGGAWRIAVADPGHPGRVVTEIPLKGFAVATSAGAGSRFDPSGSFHHLLDPATGRCAQRCLSATAMAPTAMAADALATALAVSPVGQTENLLRAFGGKRAILVLPNLDILDIGA